MSANHWPHILIFGLIIMALTATNGYTLYKSNDLSWHHLYPPTNNVGNNSFAVFDNFNSFLTTHYQKPLICPYSESFIPCDLIPGNLTYNFAFRRQISLEESLANLIYANLKLKKLLEEYEGLQQRARNTLIDLDVPFWNYKFTIHDQTEPELSIHRIRRRLEREQPNAANQVESLSQTHIGNLLSLRDHLMRDRELTHYQSRDPSAHRNEQEQANLLDNQDEKIQDQHSTTAISPSKSDVKTLKSPHAKMRTVYDKSPVLTWIFRVPLRIVTYLSRHKFEALLYVILLYLIIALIVSARNR